MRAALLAALAAVSAAPLPAQTVRVWLDGDPDVLNVGDRLRVRFRTAAPAYVAVLHIATDGRWEILYPETPWAPNYVTPGRVYALPSAAWDSWWTVTGPSGIGYLVAVAAPQPLRLEAVRLGNRWDFSMVGGVVQGDPFWAVERMVRLLVPDPWSPYAVDVYTYYVGGRFRYPRYACIDGVVGYFDPWTYVCSCDRLALLLREYPTYYDTRYVVPVRGSRYWGAYGGVTVEGGYRYKAPATSGAVPVTPPRPAAEGLGGARVTTPRGSALPRGQVTGQPRPAPRPEPEPAASSGRPEPVAQPVSQQPPAEPRPPRETRTRPPR